jgi:hypothetical protein
MTTFSTLATFTGSDGEAPFVWLMDTAGNLIGTTQSAIFQHPFPQSPTYEYGNVFEIAKTNGGYASTPTTLVNFTASYGFGPSDLIADAAGNLFGTTSSTGFPNEDGTVFEIAEVNGSYSSAPTTLVNFNGTNGQNPNSLMADAAGNLFGTTADGRFFEIAKTNGSYASTPATLATFNSGETPIGGLIADAAGDLFGTTVEADGGGTVFEIVKTNGSYASTPTTLASLDGTNGTSPSGGLIADAAGDLFGTMSGSGSDDGSVFEIAKTSTGYASTPTTLVRFHGIDGQDPDGKLIIDAAGDLLGTTLIGGAYDYGTVFEIAKINGTYVSTPTVLHSFNYRGGDGGDPTALLVTAAGTLIGTTTEGGADIFNDTGTVFELSGFSTHTAPSSDFSGNGTSDILLQNTGSGSIIDWMLSNGTYASYNPFGTAPDYTILGTGDFNGDGFYGGGVSGVLLLNNSGGEIIDWTIQNGQYSSYNGVGNANQSGYGVAGTGDFSGNGTSDILLQNGGGNLIDWAMTNGTYSGWNEIGNPASAGYGVVGSGDFTGSGTTDVLLENSGGNVIDWIIQNGVYSSWNEVGSTSGYGIVATGDYNGDGTTDILLQDNSGNLIDWTLKNGTFSGWNEVGSASGYKVVS